MFIIYIAVLVKLVVLKGPLFYQIVSGSAASNKVDSSNGTYMGFNLVPFKTIRSFMTLHPSTSTSAKVFNLLGNIALFVPMGIFLPLVFKRAKGWLKVVIATFLISLCFELFQLFTHTGHFDVDDLILNSIGGLVGYGCYLITRKYFFQSEMA